MSRRARDPLFRSVETFFGEHLQRLRGASRHTILCYRDTLRLFFSYLAERRRRSVADLRIEDVTAENVLGFLRHIEEKRHNSVTTRNTRLAALRSFIKHLMRQDPLRAAEYQRILSVPTKRKPGFEPSITYLEPEEVRALLDQPDRRRHHGARDYALLLFLYNTGARISEALAVRRSELELNRPRHVHLHGKGRRDRICPLWQETTLALRRVIEIYEVQPDGHVFLSARRQPLTRDGAAYILDKHLKAAAVAKPSIRRKHVTPHVLRHSCAVGLVQSGVDPIVIRDYLGHQSIDTTGRYAKSNLEMKRKVLQTFWEKASLGSHRHPHWRPTGDVLEFLASL